MRIVVLASFFIGIGATGNFPAWNHLSVTFKKFSALPMNEEDAKSKGWTLLYDSCKDTCTPFVGRRFILDGDYATVLIFDVNGQVAGIQMSYKTNLKEGIYKKYGDAYLIIEERDSDYYYQTAYFTEPTQICNKAVQRPNGIVGDQLFFMIAPNTYLKVPLLEQDLAGKWVKGNCVPGMGMHYWFDISTDMRCDDLFPAFILYNKHGQLVAFGFVASAHIPSPRVEYPPVRYLPLFFKKETQPTCIAKMKRSTQHVYLTRVGRYTHTCM